jgi:protocatechuate 3,4-dioxygenase beta subunit
MMTILASPIPRVLSDVFHALRFQCVIRLCFALLVLSSTQGIAWADLSKPVLISETTSTRAIALEPTGLTTQPFSPTTPSFLYGTDQRTRIMLFVVNLSLQPGEDLTTLTADAEDGLHRHYELKVEDLRPVPGQEWLSQIILRLNDNIGDVGDVLVSLVYHGVASNRVRVGIGHFGGGLPDDAGAGPTPATLYTISGLITESNNSGLSNVLVTISDNSTTRTLTTNESGAYTITLRAHGNYTVTPSIRFFNLNPQKLVFDALNANQASANFAATRQLRAISGQVRDEQGKGVDGLPVTLSSSAPNSSSRVINTSNGGFFSFTDVPAGFSYTVTPLSNSIYTFTTQDTGVLDGNLSLSFNGARRKYTISGFVKDGAEGLDAVSLTLTGGNNLSPLTIITSGGGQFSFPNVLAGYDYILTPTSAYYTFNPQAFQNLSSDRSVTFAGTMRSYTVSGLVTDENNNPLGGNIVLLYTGNLSIAKSQVTGSDGRYEFTNVPAAYSYTVGPYSTPTHSYTNQLLNGLTANLTLNFAGVRRYYTISGVVTDRSNQPVSGTSVTLSGVSNSSTLTDANGNYSFSNLPAGFIYNLDIAKTDYIFDPPLRSINLYKDEKADFTAIRTYKISGHVIDGNGHGLAGMTMTLSGAEAGKMLTASDGFYSFTVTTIGNYLLTPSKEQNFYTFAPASRSFNLSAHLSADFTGTFSPPTSPTYVLEFNGTPGTVDYRRFWPEGQVIGHFFWEFWAMPGQDTHTRYMISDGYGAAHTVLFGFNYGTDGHYNLFGNIWDGSKANYFDSDEGPAVGEWGHYAVGWDGKSLITYYDGVPVGKQPFAGPRFSAGVSWGASWLLIGGSDHQNLIGRIAQVRAYEDNNPRESAPESSFAPQTLFSQEGQFLSYYFRPSQTVADLSAGYNGGTHSGTLRGIDKGYTVDCPTCATPRYVLDPTAPDFSNPGNPGQINAPVGSPPATPVGARVFDSFSRNNSTYILGGKGGLGATETGSAGAQVWQTNQDAGALQPFGILGGHAVLLANDVAVAWVSTGASTGNLDVRVDRTLGQFGSGANTGLSFRVTDKNNFFFAYVSDDPENPAQPTKLFLGYYQSGVRTVLLSGLSMPASNWKTLRVVTTQSGGIVVYADHAQVYSTTNLTFANATGAGLFNNAAGLSLTNRWDNFTVLNVP